MSRIETHHLVPYSFAYREVVRCDDDGVALSLLIFSLTKFVLLFGG